MRRPLVIIHRWAGLFTALFLFVAGATGAVIAWDHELDEWLNPDLFEAASGHQPATRSTLALARAVEQAIPGLRVTYLPLALAPGHALTIGVKGRLDPLTGERHPFAYNQMAIDPVTAAVQGSRQWGEISLSRENLLPFLYKLHYSMHIPEVDGLELGVLVMGIVSIVWILDSFLALWISFPNPRRWRNAFAFNFRKGGLRAAFDLHRSGGVWVWGLLLMLAVTSVSMNLGRDVMKPVVSLFSPVSLTPFETRKPSPQHLPLEPQLSREQILDMAVAEAQRRAWDLPPGAIFYADRHGLYGVSFFAADEDHGDGGLGPPWLYFDGQTGALAGAAVPGEGSAGDLFMALQFPLHSGRILGLPGRVLISAMGLMVAMLSLTGVFLWWRKRRTVPASSPRAAGREAREAA